MGTTSHLINKLSVSLLRLLPPKKIGLSYFSSGWALRVIELGDILPTIAMTRLWHGLLPSFIPHHNVDHHKACVSPWELSQQRQNRR